MLLYSRSSSVSPLLPAGDDYPHSQEHEDDKQVIDLIVSIASSSEPPSISSKHRHSFKNGPDLSMYF